MSFFSKSFLNKNSFQDADALSRLTPFGPRGTIAVTLGLLALLYGAVGYFSHYWRNSDMDFMVLYSAFLMNDGRPQAYFDHPGYLTIITVQAWLRLLHDASLLNAITLSAIPAPSDAAFDGTLAAAVHALRVYVWVVGMAFAVAFYALMRRVTGDWRIASLAFTAFVFSGGVVDHLHLARTEMVAGGFVILALLVLILAARNTSAWRPVMIGTAALLCVLAMENKVQALFLIAALPVLALAFGEKLQPNEFWRANTKGGWTLVGLAMLTTLIAWPASRLVAIGLDPSAIAQAGLTPLLPSRIGLYQAAFVGWIFAGIAVYAAAWRVAWRETAATVLCVIAGGALALLALNLQFNTNNVVAVLNPLERMLTFAPVAGSAGHGGAGTLIALLVNGTRTALSQYLFFINPVPRPTIFLLWIIVPGVITAAWRGQTRLAIQCALLVATGIAMDAVGAQRAIKMEYWVFSDPFFIIAGALLLNGMTDIRNSRWAYPVGVILLVLQIGIGVSEPLKHMLQVQGPRTICTLEKEYTPLMKLPWCTSPPLRNPLADVPSVFSQTFGKPK